MLSESALPRAIAVVGPTAGGKSALGLEIAARFGLEILCCDSVQVYRGLDIGSSKPGPEEQARARHRLLDLARPDENFSAGDYARAAHAALAGGPAVFVGGTGLYLRAAAWRYSGGEAADPESEDMAARAAFEALWMGREAAAAGAIHAALTAIDAATAETIHPRNVVRALRALWLCERHGEPVSALRRRDPPTPRLALAMIVLDPGAPQVDSAIDRRCEEMLRAGWLAEVEGLRAAGYDARHKAMRSLGYHQLLGHLEGQFGLDEAIRSIKLETRHYARRQRTYFKNQVAAQLRFDLRAPAACPWPALERFLAGEPS
ncbi:MAG: tRNA (adenosine(37)-N6)-dimethylallyltransferase MiaA [Nannocystis sp.]|nr:tRNA (adenosine(37)-N6)-dimethylallyltransferase MiaA [Nannocystis sp.]